MVEWIARDLSGLQSEEKDLGKQLWKTVQETEGSRFTLQFELKYVYPSTNHTHLPLSATRKERGQGVASEEKVAAWSKPSEAAAERCYDYYP